MEKPLKRLYKENEDVFFIMITFFGIWIEDFSKQLH